MKRIVLMTVAAMCAASCSNAQKLQEKDVPAAITTAFKKQYPEATHAKWEKEDGNVEVEFELKGTECSVLMDAAGNILETEIEISMDALPVGAKEYVSKNYEGQKITETAKITDAQGTTTYEAEIKGKDLIFDSNGNFIKEVKD
jgi:uncharacterized membrane protein YkoI